MTALPATIRWEKDGKEMVLVPAGNFLMGSIKNTVYVDAFYIDQTEVTNAEFCHFLNEKGNQQEGGAAWLNINDEDCRIAHDGGRYVPQDGYADHPVVEVTWYGARAYSQWAGKRLPTEEEWEKAARGTDGRDYPWGVWAEGRCNTVEAGIGTTTPVGKYSPGGGSPYGCADMAGNVWEWTATEYYKTGARVSRGGSWVDNLNFARCAAGGGFFPHTSSYRTGFRCVAP